MFRSVLLLHFSFYMEVFFMSAYSNLKMRLDTEDLKEFSDILEIINYRPRTVESYFSSICELTTWLESNYNIPLKEITLQQVRSYVAYLKRPVEEGGRGLKPRSINVYIAAIRKYFQTVLRTPLSKADLPSMKVDHTLPSVPTKQELVKIIMGTKNLKHRAILALAYGCALRLTEVITLRCGDISFPRHTVTIRAENSKSRFEEVIELPDNLIAIITEYYNSHCRHLHLTRQDWLFPGQKAGTHLSKGTPDRVLRSRLKELGLSQCGYSFHSLRHAHALHYYLAGADIYQVQLRLRHKSIASTEIYIRLAGRLQERRNIENPFDDPGFKA